jgi:hypothetical protein
VSYLLLRYFCQHLAVGFCFHFHFAQQVHIAVLFAQSLGLQLEAYLFQFDKSLFRLCSFLNFWVERLRAHSYFYYTKNHN